MAVNPRAKPCCGLHKLAIGLSVSVSVSVSLAVAIPTQVTQLRKTPAEVAPFPPMQWHSFGEIPNGDGQIDEALLMECADALISTGMAEAGYDTINVVCNGWIGRDPVTHQLSRTTLAGRAGSRGLPRSCTP